MNTMSRMVLWSLGASLALVMGCAPDEDPQATDEPTEVAKEALTSTCATLYADASWQGASLTVAPGTSNVPGSFNDVTSSVAVTSGCTLVLYADANESAMAVTFTSSSATVPAAFNDAASSYTCSCPPPPPPPPPVCKAPTHWCGPDEGCQYRCW